MIMENLWNVEKMFIYILQKNMLMERKYIEGCLLCFEHIEQLDDRIHDGRNN